MMRQDQIKYVRTRAEAILATKKTELNNKYSTPAVQMTNIEKAEAIQKGDFTISLSDVSDRSYGTQWYQAVKFKGESQRQFNQKAYDKDIAKLMTAYNKLLDELLLGDNTQALALLRNFEGVAVESQS